ncbi:MAG TPA: glycosyltransferase family 2 protein [Solirubrobacteraceae bacterium]|nr:glycosyltransferase family 2 protein [Solirubrobacteraceae bacterium]
MEPTVTIVFLVFNRRDELRESLQRMLRDSEYPRERVDAIVVDNASTDGAAEMVRAEFGEVQLIRREENTGVSAWNDGLAVARGDYVLVLDDDCYLPADGLSRAVAAAQEHGADLVSFGVTASADAGWRFDQKYRTGLLSFWGCAALMRREVVERLGGYDPEIFVWANELEFTIRFFDAGFRHLHAPEIVAVHMKAIDEGDWHEYLRSRAYRINARHFAYIAAKLLRRRDAAEALVAILTGIVRDALRSDLPAGRALGPALGGFAHGLRHRSPVRNPEVSSVYRRNFHSFASPWWLSRTPLEMLRGVPPNKRRREAYMQDRARFYPTRSATLEL